MVLRMKWAAIVIFVLLATAAGFYRWPISSAFVADEPSARLSQSLGLELGRPGSVRFSLLPAPTLHMVDVELRGRDNATILTAPKASARLALLPLLLGHFQLAGATLRGPTILVDLDSRPFAASSAISTTIATKGDDKDSAPLGALQIQGGLLRIVSAANKIDTLVEDVDGALDWPRLEDRLRINLRATWRDEPLAIEASLGEPAALLRGGRSDGHLSVVSGGAQIKLQGDFLGDGADRFEGSASLDIASISEVRRILGLPSAAIFADGKISLAAQATANSQMLTLSDMRLNLLGQNFEGALAIARASERPSVSGTLATDELKLEPILANAPSLIDSKGDWSAAPFDFAPLTAVDFDLRVSAAQIKWRGHPLADAAIELMNDNGRLTATLVEASAYNGLFKAEISFAPAQSGCLAHASGALKNADLGALFSDFGWSAYSGQGDGEFALDAVGDSPAALARALDGKATVKLAPGVVDGVSFEEALRRSERRPIDVFNDMRRGRTVFTEASASMTLQKGVGGVVNGSMVGVGVNVSLAGSIDIFKRRLLARATAIQTGRDGVPTPHGPRLDFDITGPWSAPTIKPFVGG
jgi:AsmA protein